MKQRVLLDLFCGAGGASMGYYRAGFQVVGVDIKPQPHYPFMFIRADALKPPLCWDNFDAIHASPPCQDYSKALRHFTSGYPRLLDPVREMLKSSGKPYVIENVIGAPLPHQDDLFGTYGVILCGTMFDLPIWRHRIFECSIPIVRPNNCNHTERPMNVYRAVRPGGRTPFNLWRKALDVEWMSHHEASESIPPAYTEYIGQQLHAAL